ncbi:hypothetical protein QTP88_018843 [Uroleucon formosanum]
MVNLPKPLKQCAHIMNTVRSCYAATSILVVVISWSTANAVICCNSSSVASGGGIASCQNENRKFHTIEAIGGATCDDNQTAVSIRKCCLPGQLYDPEVRFCIQAGLDGDVYLRRMMWRLRNGFRAVADAVMVGYDYDHPLCDTASVLVDVPAVEVRGLMEADTPAAELPPGYCFDLTPSDELVARTCRPRDQYCGWGRYSCVNKCCKLNQRIVASENGPKCEWTDKPFTLSAYETDAEGRPVGLSNISVLSYNVILQCVQKVMVMDGFKFTTDGSLYHTVLGKHVPDTGYCLDNYAEDVLSLTSGLRAIMCHTKPPFTLLDQICHMSSAVCLALTLLVYAKLSYLRNVHGYYFMCYISCLLILFICIIIHKYTLVDDIKSQFCIIKGYFTLFAYLTTFCWLNVISFDIYWTVRYNNNINRNSSISLRTIMYHIYCWGFSSTIVSTGYLFQHSQYEKLKKIAPDIGDFNCFFKDLSGYGLLIFYKLPACVTLTANLIFFLLTAIHYLRIKSKLNKFKQTNDLKIQRFHVEKEKFVTSFKLFLVMGIPITIEMPRLFFKNKWIIWEILSVITSLQGVLTFIILVAKRKVIMDLWKKFRGSMDHSESTQINTISGTS